MATTLDAFSDHANVGYLEDFLLYGGSLSRWHDINEAAAFWIYPGIGVLSFTPIPAVQLDTDHLVYTCQEEMERIDECVRAQNLERVRARGLRGRP